MPKIWPVRFPLLKLALFAPLLISPLFVKASSAEITNKTKALRLSQVYKAFGGVRLLVNQKALKIYVQDYRTCVLAVAPKWDLVYYNPRERVFHKWTYEQFKKSGTSLSASEEYPALSAITSNCHEHLSAKVKCFATTTAQKNEYKACILESKEVAPQAITLLSKLYRLPDLKGIPICADKTISADLEENSKASPKNVSKRVHEASLSTQSIAVTDVDPAEFKLPDKMTAVAKESGVSFPHSPANGLIDMLTQGASEPKK